MTIIHKSIRPRPASNGMRRGQGLIETIVAIGIITTGLFSVITLVISNLTTQREAALRYQATNLAREGLELTRNLRDTNWLQGRSTWEGMEVGTVAQDMQLRFNPENPEDAIPELIAGGNMQVYRNTAELYVQTGPIGGSPSMFQRTLTLRQLNCGISETVPCDPLRKYDPDYDIDTAIALEIISEVAWTDSGRERVVTLNQILYDWR